MNILKDFDYELYNEYLADALEDQVHIVHQNFGFGGYTFCWKRTIPNKSCRVLKVAVSFCSPKDQFCKKIGTFNVLDNFYNGRLVQLPVGDSDSAKIVQRLRTVFSLLDHF